MKINWKKVALYVLRVIEMIVTVRAVPERRNYTLEFEC